MEVTAPPDTAAAATADAQMPEQFQTRNLRLRALQAAAALAVLFAIVLLAPGLGDVRAILKRADPGWLALAAALEGLSCLSYVVMFGPVFCTGLSWRRNWQIAGSELAMGSLVPASGAGGLALGAWILSRGGMDGARIARRSVSFFLIKSGVNFLAVAVIGLAMFLGVGPSKPLYGTLLPAIVASLCIAAVALLPKLGRGGTVDPDALFVRRGITKARHALVDGIYEAGQILRSGNFWVIAGAIGYWLFDNAVLWATFKSFGFSPPVTVILMGYLIGQLGGALPIPGGVGGIDLGLIGVLVAYGAPAAGTTAAVLAYHVILFWIPLIAGGVSFLSLRRDMPSKGELASCAPAVALQSA
jgi:uncharacterized membrane protein YbhN (UPF0104 family)